MSVAEQRHAPSTCKPGQLCPPLCKLPCWCAWSRALQKIVQQCGALHQPQTPRSPRHGACCHETHQAWGRVRQGQGGQAPGPASPGPRGRRPRPGRRARRAAPSRRRTRSRTAPRAPPARAPRSRRLVAKCTGAKVRSACRHHPARRQEALLCGLACLRPPPACTKHLAYG